MLRIPEFSKEFDETDGTMHFPGFCFPSAAIAILSGGNGTGKTTFLNTVYAMCQNGLDTTCFYLKQMYEHLLYPYKPIWWNVCLQDVIRGNASTVELKKRTQKYLTKFNLGLDINRYPKSLSGGEKHIVLVLRMMLSDHKLLLLDEPLTGVDAARIQILWRLLETLVYEYEKYVLFTSHIPVPGIAEKKLISFVGFNRSKLTLSVVDGKDMNITKFDSSTIDDSDKNKD